MKTQSSYRAVSILVLLPQVLTAQVSREREIPLKPWPAPLYWQPTQAEARAIAGQPDAGTPSPQAAAPENSLVFVAITPCRVVDTRAGQGFTGAFGPPILAQQASRTFPIQSSTTCSIPAIAQAYSFNVTVVPPGFLGFITLFPTGATRPNASTLDDSTGLIIANAAIVPGGTNGSVDVFANNPTDLIIDINGYYAAQSGITLAQGSAGAPSLSFSGDATTGIFSSGAGTLSLATGGTNRLTVRSDGDLDLSGNIRKGGILFINTRGTNSAGLGMGALANNAGLNANAFGLSALGAANTGPYNNAFGVIALGSNTTGSSNNAHGDSALAANTTGGANSAFGDAALQGNQTGSANTAVGSFALGALLSNGSNNTAVGQVALQSNTSGHENTAVGQNTMQQMTTGSLNTALGQNALHGNSTGSENTAVGTSALVVSTGSDNTALGKEALNNLASGDNNIAIGVQAGGLLNTGSNNIFIGNAGGNTVSNTMSLGGANQTSTFIAGISGTSISGGVTVLIAPNGKLGTVNSSRRYKEDIQNMGEASSGLLRLRPVTFRYKRPYEDGSKPLEYGLIAEEVDEVYPDLVVRGKDGQVETVQYQKLTPMLLNELQKQDGTIGLLREQNRQQQEKTRQLEGRLAALEALLTSKSASAGGR